MRLWRHRAAMDADPDRRALRRLRRRLAALTVGLLCALLLAVAAAVYVTMQSALMQSAQSVLISSASTEMHHVLDRVHDQDDQYGSEPLQVQQSRGGMFVIFADLHLTVLGGGASPFGRALFDPHAAQDALHSGEALFSTRVTSPDQHYLIYSTLAKQPGGTVVGVVQAGMSLRQYEDSLHTLLRVLLLIGAMGLAAAGIISVVLVRRALDPIQAALRRQRDFVADAAHELRTPLTILRTAAELGLADQSGDEATAALEQALVQGSHLTRLVDDLSLLARADSGAMTLARAPIDLGKLVTETAGSVEILANERGVRLCVEIHGITRVIGDPGRLRQLLLILLDNALKHTDEGDSVTVRVEPRGHQGRLIVRDTGPGIDPLDVPLLFDRFYRSDRARAGTGTGLGLAIGRWIVEAHGGHISGANAPDHGAVFSVTLPLAPP